MRVLPLILICMTYSAMSQKKSDMNFSNVRSIDSIMHLAGQKNLPVFIDFYTTWCVPCKRMEEDVFTQENVSKFFKDSFLNVRIDAEKGAGIRLAKKYSVTGYPCFVFINSEGRLLYKQDGYMEANLFITAGNLAMSEFRDTKPYFRWEKDYDSKKKDTSFLYEFIKKRNKLKINSSELLERYYTLLASSQYFTKKNLSLILAGTRLKSGDKIFLLIARNFTTIRDSLQNPGKVSALHDKLFDALLYSYRQAVQKKDNQAIEKLVTAFEELPVIQEKPWFSEPDGDEWHFLYAKEIKNVSAFLKIAPFYLRKHYMNLPVEEMFEKDKKIFEASINFYISTGLDTVKSKGFTAMLTQQLSHYYSNAAADKLYSAASFLNNNAPNIAALHLSREWITKALEVKPGSEEYLALKKQVSAKLTSHDNRSR